MSTWAWKSMILKNMNGSSFRIPYHYRFSKLFIRFAFYKNAKRAHCTQTINTTKVKVCVHKFLVKCNFVGNEWFKNNFSFANEIYDMILKIGIWPLPWPLPQVWILSRNIMLYKEIFQNNFMWKVIHPCHILQKCKMGSITSTD